MLMLFFGKNLGEKSCQNLCSKNLCSKNCWKFSKKTVPNTSSVLSQQSSSDIVLTVLILSSQYSSSDIVLTVLVLRHCPHSTRTDPSDDTLKKSSQVNYDGDPSDDTSTGHGTATAGAICAHGGNGVGIASLACTNTVNVKVMPVKVLDAQGVGTLTSVIAGLEYAALNGARVAALPFWNTDAGASANVVMGYAMDNAHSTSYLLSIGAAGNGFRQDISSSAGYSMCVCRKPFPRGTASGMSPRCLSTYSVGVYLTQKTHPV